MFEFLWWLFLVVSSVGIGYYTAGIPAAIFMILLGILGAISLLLEKKLHPVIDAKQNE